MATVNQELQDRAIRHALALDKYSRGLSDKVVRLLNTADKDLLEKLAARIALIDERGTDRGPQTTKRLRALLDELRAINGAIYGEVREQLIDELTQLSTAEAGFQKASLQTAMPISLAAKLPTPARLRAIVISAPMDGRLLSPWIDQLSAGRIAMIEQQLNVGLVAGESTDRLVARIRGTRARGYSDGVLSVSRRSAQTMVRTAVTHVSNVAAQETWKANDDVVKGWVFTATLDSRTTSECASKDGEVHPIGGGPIPPLHRGCRSITVALTKSYRELGLDKDELTAGTRASMDGQVSASLTYPEWLKTKSLAVQEQVLGKTRARWFNEGKLTYKDLVRGDGSLMTLDELREAYPSILAK